MQQILEFVKKNFLSVVIVILVITFYLLNQKQQDRIEYLERRVNSMSEILGDEYGGTAIEDLQGYIEELEAEVGNVKFQIINLESQIDDLENKNDDLEFSVIMLQSQTW